MKHPKQMTLVATLGLVFLGVNTLQAQLPMNLNVKLTAQSQDLIHEQVGTSPKYKSTITKMRISNKDLLSLLEVAYTNADFSGYTLAVDDNNGDFIIVDKNGNVIRDATADGFMSNFFNTEGDSLEKGSDNHNTGSENYAWLYTNYLTFDDSTHGNHFDFHGLELWVYKYNGNSYKFIDSFKLDGAGSGSLDTAPGNGGSVSLFLLSGSISGKAKGID